MSTSFAGISESALLHTSLTWTIDNFSFRDTYVRSPAFFDEKKNTFYLCLHPDKEKWIYLQIEMKSKETTKVKCRLSLINSKGTKCFLLEQTGSLISYPNCPDFSYRCIPKFISRLSLFEPSNGYIFEDTLTIHCEICHLDMEKSSMKTSLKAVIGGPSKVETSQKALQDFGSLLKTGNLTDVKLIVAGQTIPAHTQILGARSPVFAAMFTHDTKEKQDGQVEILDVSLEAFEALLEFLYTGEMPTLDGIKSAEELLIAADKYDAEQLKTACEMYLVAQLTIETAPSLLLFANSVNALKLKESAVKFVCGRGSELFNAIQNDSDQLVNFFQGLAEKN